MKRIVMGWGLSTILVVSLWYVDVLHRPVEAVEPLIGHNSEYARTKYFCTEPDHHYRLNTNKRMNEFNGGILIKKHLLIDSIVDVYTWKSVNHKTTIWIGRTAPNKKLIIDAIRYKDGVKF